MSEQGVRAGAEVLPFASIPIASVALPATTMSRLHSAAGGRLWCVLCAVLCLCGGPLVTQLAARSALQDGSNGALMPNARLPSQGTESAVLRRRRCVRCKYMMGAQAWTSTGSQDIDNTGHQCLSSLLGLSAGTAFGADWNAARHVQAGRRNVATGRQCAFRRPGLAVSLAMLRARGLVRSALQRPAQVCRPAPVNQA